MTTQTIKHEGVTLQIGDKVVALADGQFGDVLKGQVAIVSHTDAGDFGDPHEIMVDLLDEDGNYEDHDYFEEKDLELYVAPTKLATFEVGDKVKILAVSKHGKEYVGQIGVVADSRGYEPYIAASPEDKPNGLYLPEQLELVEVEAEVKFEKGDEVKVLATSVFGADHIGSKGTVVKVYADDYAGYEGCIVVDVQGSDTGRVYKPASLELLRKASDIKTENKTEGETNMTKTLKVGDKVRVLNADNGRYGDLKDGSEGVITEIGGMYDIEPYKVFSDEEGDYDRYFAEDIELIVPFQVGDEVRMISTNPHYTFGLVSTGDIGTITEISENMITADFAAQSGWNGKPGEFELVNEFDQFQPGDKVTLVSGGREYPLNGFDNGTEYEVVSNDYEHDSVGRAIKLKNPSRLFGGYALPAQLEKVVAPAVTKAPVKSENKYQAGDKVVLVTNYGECSTSASGTEIGDVLTIIGDSKLEYNTYAVTQPNGKVGYVSDYHVIPFVEAPKAELAFEVGDKVTIVNYRKGKFKDQSDGDVGTIETIGEDHKFIYKVRVASGDYDRFNADGLKIAPVDAPVQSSTTAYEVGDKVRMINKNRISCAYATENGNEYEVVEVREYTGSIVVIDGEGDRLCIHASEQQFVEKVEAPEELSEGGFKVGDIVEIVANKHSHGFRIGDKVRIVAIVTFGINKIMGERVDGTRVGGNFLTPGEIKMFVEPTPTFEIGDRVAVERGPYMLDADELTGTVESMVSPDRFRVKLDNYPGSSLSFNTDAMTLLPEAQRSLQVGDIVRIDRNGGIAAGSVNEDGDIGVVTDTQYGTSTKVQVSGRVDYGNYELTTYLTLLVATENREDK